MDLRDKRAFTIKELLLVFLAVFLLTLALQPAVMRTKERSDELVCLNNIREIGKALYIYAEEKKGAFPPSLKALYDEEYLADSALMDCPAAKGTGTPGSPDYIYTGGLSVKDPSQNILVQDKPGNHPQGGKNIFLVDGTAAWRAR